MALKQGFFVFLATVIVVAAFLQFAAHTTRESDALLEHGPTSNRDDSPRGAYFSVLSVRGERASSDAGEPLDTLWVLVALSPRAGEADLARLTLEASNGATHRQVTYSEDGSGQAIFSPSVVRNTGGTFSPFSPVLSRGDLIELEIDLIANDLPIAPRQAFFLDLVYDGKLDVSVAFHSPASFTDSRIVRML